MIQQNWVYLIIAGIFIGIDKGGLKPLMLISMLIITKIVSPQQMLAIVAPLLLIGEFYPCYHYRKDMNKKAVFNFIPWAFIGILAGIFIGKNLDERSFKSVISIIILVMAILTTIKYYKKISIPIKYDLFVTSILGSLAGFSSTIGNAAGPLSNIYFLNKTDGKRELIGSNSLLYIFINSVKLVLYAIFWKNFSLESFYVTLFLIPFIFIGIFIATKLIKIIPEKVYKFIILASIYYAGISFLIG